MNFEGTLLQLFPKTLRSICRMMDHTFLVVPIFKKGLMSYVYFWQLPTYKPDKYI